MIAAIILAAGQSSRYGEQKLLVPIAGRPLLRWTAETIASSGVDHTIVVIGPAGSAHRDALDGLEVEIVVNPRPELGMASSLRAGIAALPASADAALIALGDQPAIPENVVPRLIARFNDGGAAIVMPAYRGERGHPVLFAASMFGDLITIDGDRGARDLLAQRPDSVVLVEVDAAVPSDVDTAADIDAVESEVSRRSSRTA